MPVDQLDPQVEIHLRAALRELADDAACPDIATVLGHGPRRRWPLLVLAAAVALIVAAITIPLAVRTRDVEPAQPPIPAGVRVPGNWSMITEITPPDGWIVAQREVYLTAEQTILTPRGVSGRKVWCAVDFSAADPTEPAPSGNTVRLAGRSGVYSTDQGDGSFTWNYDAGALASVHCGGMKDPKARIATVLPGVKRGFTEVRIPFRLTAVPAGYEVKYVTQGENGPDDERGVHLGDLENDPGIDQISISWMDLDPTTTPPMFENATGRAAINGRQWVYFQAGDQPAACLDQRPTICVINDKAGGTRDEVWNRILGLLPDLEPAADLTNPAGWPSARDALPRTNR